MNTKVISLLIFSLFFVATAHSMESTSNPFDILPPEQQLIVLLHCNNKTLCNLEMVCTTFNKMGKNLRSEQTKYIDQLCDTAQTDTTKFEELIQQNDVYSHYARQSICNILQCDNTLENNRDIYKNVTKIVPECLSFAINNNSLLATYLCIKQNANNLILNNKHAIFTACEQKHNSIVKLFLDTGTPIDIRDNTNNTLFISAACYNNFTVYKLLIDAHNIFVNEVTENGNTALIMATFEGRTDIVKHLLTIPNINVNTANNGGNTALMWAAYQGHINIIKLLLTIPNINVHTADQYDEAAFMSAVRGGYIEIIKLLLVVPDIDVNTTSGTFGKTALIYAAQKNLVNTVKFLLTMPQIDVNKSDILGNTAIKLAAREGHTNIFKLLLAMPQININQKDLYGDTVLIAATRAGDIDLIKLLLAEPRINVNKISTNGYTALKWALDNEHTEIVSLLRNAGAHHWYEDHRIIIKTAAICFSLVSALSLFGTNK